MKKVILAFLLLAMAAVHGADNFNTLDATSGAVAQSGTWTAGIVNGINIAFPSPLKGTAATLLEMATLTASITGSFYGNCQGYVAP